MTRISFIVPTCNRAHFVAESLRSILSQMGEADELVVIDDGSTDDTAAVVRGFGDRIRYVAQDNAGKSAALNRAMAITDGAYVWVCDDDDLLRPGAVERLFDALDGSELGFVFGRYSPVSGDPVYWPDMSRGSLVRHMLENAFVMQGAALVRRSVYDAVGPFDEKMLRSLDYEMFVRLALAAPAACVDTIVFDQREHDGPRGPARALHAAANSSRVRMEYDRRIFERVRAAVPITFYEGMFASGDHQLLRRAALIQRAAILARHDLWSEAVADLESAARLAGDVGLTVVERDLCARMVGGKHGFSGAIAPDISARLAALRHRRPLGRTIVRAMLGGALSHARRGQPGDRRDARRLLIRVGGVIGVARLLVARLVPWRGRRRPLRLYERDRVPPELLRAGNPLAP